MTTKSKNIFLCILLLLTVLTGCAKSPSALAGVPEMPTAITDDSSVLPDISTTTHGLSNTPEVATEPEIPSKPSATSNVLPVLSTTTEAVAKPTEADATVNSQIITGTLQIAFLDVGQGDSIYISLPNGESILIDAGEASASESVIQFIKDNNNRGTIDYIVSTHPHSDHIGGLASVINEFDVKSVWMPDIIHTTKTFENLLDTIEANNLSIDIAKAGKTLFDYGNLKAVFIAPNSDVYSNINNYSAAILLTYNDIRFLLMGDAEKESEAEILAAGLDISTDVLKVGHHGSATSSTNAFIKAALPKYAVISCGKGNSYGHPTSQTLAVLAEFGIDVKRTDESGTLIFSCDGEYISCTAFQIELQPRAPTNAQTETYEPSIVKEEPAKTQEINVTVYATKTGKKYHSDGCRYLSQSKIPINLDEARQKYDPCSVCNPPR